jgi:tetratricopeptide (TPR) repeat protein
MKRKIIKMKVTLTFTLLLLSLIGFAQDTKVKPEIKQAEKQLFRKGNDLYNDENYVDAEVQYKKALEQNPNYEKANYNLGNAIYQQNRFKEALPLYDLVSKTTESKLNKAESFHNTGNSMMKEKQYDKAVEAYKNALRNNHEDDETRYNLALAQEMLKKQQNQNKDKDQDKKDNKDNKDKENKDQDKKEDQNKDKENEDKGDKKPEKKDENKDKQEPKPQQNKLSPQQIKQLLEAMNNEENKTQQKVNAQKAKGSKVKQEKDW